MEIMVRKICLDSDVLIALLHEDKKTKELLESLDAIFYTTAVNSFEVWYGRKKTETVFQLLETLHILDMTDSSARKAGDILLELKRTGALLDIRDTFIAGICIQHDVELLTYNRKHFERIKRFGLMLV
jgi:predicted nucleic acid-binding protein